MLNKENNTGNKKGLTYSLIVFAIALLVVLIMIYLEPISDFVSIIFSVIAPIALGGAIAYALNPILKFLEFFVLKKIRNKRLLRALSLILTYLYLLLIITLAISVISPQITKSIIDIGKNYNLYVNTTLETINSTISRLSATFENLNVSIAKDTVSDIINESSDIFKDIFNYIFSYGKSLLTTFKNLILGLFISIYILAAKERLYAHSIKTSRAFMSPKMFNNCMRYVRVANSTFGRFFIGKLFDSTIVFVITFVVLALLKMPHAMLIAIIVAALNIIPFFGIILGIVLSSFIILIASPDKFVIFIIVMIIIQQIDANIIAPKILGSSAGISSLGVITAVIIMGAYFDIVGMIIGVPLFAIIIAIFKEWLEKRLSAKKLPVKTAEYYEDPDYSSESEEYKSFTRLLFDPLLKKASKKVNHTISRDLKKNDITEDEDDTEDYNDSSTNDDNY